MKQDCTIDERAGNGINGCVGVIGAGWVYIAMNKVELKTD